MLRAALLLIVLFGFVCASALVDAQTPPPATAGCNMAAARNALAAGAEPNFRRCLLQDAQDTLAANGVNARVVRVEPQPKVAGDTIVEQRWVRNQLTFFVVPPPLRRGIDIPVSRPDPPPPPRPVTFSIDDAPPAQEGEALVFPIGRDWNDNRTHRLNLTYSDPTLVRNPRASIDIEPQDASLRFETVATPSGDGAHRLRVTIERGDERTLIGRSDSGVGLISDTPEVLPAPPTPASTGYMIARIGQAERGETVRFRISRTGDLPAATIGYAANQDGRILPPLIMDQIDFAEGEPSDEAAIAGERYNVCSNSVGIALVNVSGPGTSLDWQFPEAAPEACFPQPWWKPFLPPGPLWWLPPAILLLSLLLLWRRWPDPDPDPDPDPVPSPDVQAVAAIEAGSWSFDPRDEAMGRWPALERHIVIERGDAKMPDPLPSRTMTDG